jgi:hypothetical protein
MSKNNWGNYTQSSVIDTPNAKVFVSYYTPIAIVKDDYVLVVDQKFSSTTSKQTTRFLRDYGSLNIAYIKPDEFKKALNFVGYSYSTGWIR